MTGLEAGVVLVSHDRAFLERTVTSVVELDEHTRRPPASTAAGSPTWRSGPWPAATPRRPTSPTTSAARAGGAGPPAAGVDAGRRQPGGEAPTRQRQVHQALGHRQRRGSLGRRQAHRPRARAARAGRQALGGLGAAARAGRGTAQRQRGGPARRRRRRAGPFRLGPVDLQVDWADRLAIVGTNGSGKTTLLAALLGEVPLAAGARWLGPSVVVGELDQARRRLDPGACRCSTASSPRPA